MIVCTRWNFLKYIRGKIAKERSNFASKNRTNYGEANSLNQTAS